MKMRASRDISPCGLTQGGLSLTALMAEAASTSDTSVNCYK